MIKPSPTDATTKLDAARTAVRDHIKDLIDWRSSMTLRGNKTTAASAWDHITELREVSDQLDVLVSSWTELTGERTVAPLMPTPTQGDLTTREPHFATSEHKSRRTTKLIVRLPDGATIAEQIAADTLQKFVEWVGVEKILSMNIQVNRQPFVSTKPLDKYGKGGWKKVGDYFIETTINNVRKRTIIRQIAKNLGINVLVEII